MAPNDPDEVRCFQVDYTGTLDATYQLKFIDAFDTHASDGLAGHMTMLVESGTGGQDCITGTFSTDLAATTIDTYIAANDVSAISTVFDSATDGATATYRVTVSFPDTTDNTLQAETVSFDLEWLATQA